MKKRPFKLSNYHLGLIAGCVAFMSFGSFDCANNIDRNAKALNEDLLEKMAENNPLQSESEQKTVSKPASERKSQADNAPKQTVDAFAGVQKGLELPAKADKTEKRTERVGYTFVYDAEKRVPKWVAWVTTKQRIKGKNERTNDFLPDPDLSVTEAVTKQVYSGSGYDRGHMCPAADNKWDATAMMESFYMTNICPQTPELNRGDWNDLENSVRDWAKKYGPIYQCCGPIFDKTPVKTIRNKRSASKMRVAVPDRFFKVLLCMGDNPCAIGFVFINDGRNMSNFDSYAMSVDEVEKITGFNFFASLPKKVETKVEAMTYSQWKNIIK